MSDTCDFGFQRFWGFKVVLVPGKGRTVTFLHILLHFPASCMEDCHFLRVLVSPIPPQIACFAGLGAVATTRLARGNVVTEEAPLLPGSGWKWIWGWGQKEEIQRMQTPEHSYKVGPKQSWIVLICLTCLDCLVELASITSTFAVESRLQMGSGLPSAEQMEQHGKTWSCRTCRDSEGCQFKLEQKMHAAHFQFSADLLTFLTGLKIVLTKKIELHNSKLNLDGHGKRIPCLWELIKDPQCRAARTNLESERLLWSRATPWLLWMWVVNLRFAFLCTASRFASVFAVVMSCFSQFCALSACKHFAPGSKEKSLAGILDTNCFRTDSSADVRVLCPTLARFNHSCLPNCPSAACEHKCCSSQLTIGFDFWMDKNMLRCVADVPDHSIAAIPRQALEDLDRLLQSWFV